MSHLSTAEVAKLAGVTYHAFYAYVKEGVLPPPTRIAGRLFWTRRQAREACRIVKLRKRKPKSL